MLVHRRVTTHLYTWTEKGPVRVKCLAHEHNTELEPRSLDPQSSALTMRPPPLYILHFNQRITLHSVKNYPFQAKLLPVYHRKSKIAFGLQWVSWRNCSGSFSKGALTDRLGFFLFNCLLLLTYWFKQKLNHSFVSFRNLSKWKQQLRMPSSLWDHQIPGTAELRPDPRQAFLRGAGAEKTCSKGRHEALP